MLIVAVSMALSLLAPLAPSAVDGCSDVAVVGARGSGQIGYGDQVQAVVDEVTVGVSELGGTVSSVALDYPAVSISDNFGLALFNGDYNRSVQTGAANLLAVLDDLGQRCPGTSIVLVGYSQGSQVVKAAMAGRPPVDRIASVVLLADPSRDTLQLGVFRFGNLDGIGALGSEPLAAHIRPLTLDVCALTDAVCSGGGLDFQSHINGYDTVSAVVLETLLADVERSLLRYRRLL